MIKGLMGTGAVIVDGGNTSLPYVTQNNTNPMQGAIRIWGSDMQVFDGSNWMTMSTSYATVSLDPETQDLLLWARQKRDEERKLQELAKKYLAVADGLDAVEQAKTKLKIITELVS